MKGVAGILRELVGIASVSHLSNRPLIDLVTRRLRDAGWATREQAYTDALGAEKVNLLARPAEAAFDRTDVALAWICHSDTVPFAEDWAGATRLEERDGLLYGCGACDVKGSLACFLAAVERVPVADVTADCALMVTADEEVGCLGTERLLDAGWIRPKRLIVSEPTGLSPAVAGKGYGLAEVTLTGRPAHSAFPEEGASAISAGARLIAAISAEMPGSAWRRDTLFAPPHTSVNVGVIAGGTAKNVIPAECRFLLEWRPVPGEEAGFVAEELGRLAQAAQAGEAGTTVRVEVRRSEGGFRLPGKELGQELAARLGTKPIGIAFSSEASRWTRVSEEVVVLGPGDMRTAHSERECVPVSELERWTECIAELFRR